MEALERAGGNDIVNFIYEAKLSPELFDKTTRLDHAGDDAVARHTFIKYKYQQLRYFDASVYEVQIKPTTPRTQKVVPLPKSLQLPPKKNSRSQRLQNRYSKKKVEQDVTYNMPANLAVPKTTRRSRSLSSGRTKQKMTTTTQSSNNNNNNNARGLSQSMRAPSAERSRSRSTSSSRGKNNQRYEGLVMDEDDTSEMDGTAKQSNQRRRSTSSSESSRNNQAPKPPLRRSYDDDDDANSVSTGGPPPRMPSRRTSTSTSSPNLLTLLSKEFINDNTMDYSSTTTSNSHHHQNNNKSGNPPPRMPSRRTSCSDGSLVSLASKSSKGNKDAAPKRYNRQGSAESDNHSYCSAQQKNYSSKNNNNTNGSIDMYSPEIKRGKLKLGLGADPAKSFDGPKKSGVGYGYSRRDSVDSDNDSIGQKKHQKQTPKDEKSTERRGSTGGLRIADSPALGCFLQSNATPDKLPNKKMLVDERSVGSKSIEEYIAGIKPVAKSNTNNNKKSLPPKKHSRGKASVSGSGATSHHSSIRKTIDENRASSNSLSGLLNMSNQAELAGTASGGDMDDDSNSISNLSSFTGFSFGSANSSEEKDAIERAFRNRQRQIQRQQEQQQKSPKTVREAPEELEVFMD